MSEKEIDPRAGDAGAGEKSCSGEPEVPATTSPQAARQELEVDRGTIGEFFSAIFRHADPDGHVLLRAFAADRPWEPWSWYALEVGDIRNVVATHRAAACANAPDPVVFCPPLATFRREKDGRAREENLANGLVISVECDSRPALARAILEQVLGMPHCVAWNAPRR